MNFGPTRKGAAANARNLTSPVVTLEAESQSLESRVRCATKHTDAMDSGPIAHSKWAMGLWSVAVGEVPDGERAAPKRPGEVRDRPPRRQVWQSDSMVSSNELGFDLRESSPLPHNILSRVRLATDPDVGQPVGSSSGLRGCTIASYNPKGEACHLDYHVSTGDSAKSGLGHFDHQP